MAAPPGGYCRAMARPIPRPAPVTSAIFSAKTMRNLLGMQCLLPWTVPATIRRGAIISCPGPGCPVGDALRYVHYPPLLVQCAEESSPHKTGSTPRKEHYVRCRNCGWKRQIYL